MNRRATPPRTPYDFNRSVMFPFKSGPNSLAFVFKSPVLYALVSTVLLFIFGRGILGTFTELIQYMENLEVNAEPDIKLFLTFMSFYGKIMQPFLIVGLFGWFIMAMIEAAFYRRVFTGENKAYPWRFGRDELRVMLSQIIFGLLAFGLVALFYLVIGGIVMSMIASSSGGNETNGALAGVFALLLFVGFIVLFPLTIFLSIRLSPIAALSVLREKISIKETWRVTKGRFWPIVGSFVIVAVLAYMINYGIQMVVTMIMFANMGSMVEEFEAMDGADVDMVMDKIVDIVSQPSFLITLAIFIFIYMAVQMIVRLLYSGITANAVDLYRQDLGETDLEVFD